MARRRLVSSSAFHRIGHAIGVEDGAAFEMAGAAADGLDERSAGTQEAFFVGVENGDERDFGQVESFAQKIDADQYVELAFAQIAQNFDPLERFDFRVHVAALHADFAVVLGEIFGHALGEGGYQHAFAFLDARADLVQQVVDLAFHRADFDWRIDQSGGADDLLDDDSGGFSQLVRAGRG